MPGDCAAELLEIGVDGRGVGLLGDGFWPEVMQTDIEDLGQLLEQRQSFDGEHASLDLGYPAL